MKRSAVAMALVLGSAWQVMAQEAEPPMPRVVTVEAVGDAKGDGNVIISRISGDGGGIFFSAPIMMAPGSGMGFGFGAEDDLGIAGGEQFQDEIGLVPEQKEKLTTLRKEIQERRTKLIQEYRAAPPEKLGAQLQTMETQLRDEVKKRLGDILLPHQLERIKQIRVQSQIRNRGVTALAGGELAEALALTDKQKTELLEKQRKAEKELREKIDALRKEAQKELLDEVLTPDQREKLAKLTGAEVKPKPIELPAIRPLAPKVKSGE